MCTTGTQCTLSHIINIKDNLIPLQALAGPWGSRMFRHPDGGKVSPTYGPPLPPGDIPGIYLCWRLIDPGFGSIRSMKNPGDPIGGHTRDLTACSTVLQPTAPPRAAVSYNKSCKYCEHSVPHYMWGRTATRSLPRRMEQAGMSLA
jgi:hypothetical protein